VIATATVAGFLHSTKEQKQKQKVYHQHPRAAPKFHDDTVDEKTDDTEEEIDFSEDASDVCEEEEEDDPDDYCQADHLTCGGETIGIDLGTAFSCVGVWENGNVKIISNEVGNRTTPSIISFAENATVGDNAKLQAVTNARNTCNTVYNTKRLIGLNFTDHGVQDDMERWPFSVASGPGDIPYIEVDWKGEKKKMMAEEISCMILMKMKGISETYLKKRVTDAVITVPAHFNYNQRQATICAGSRAGLNVRIMNDTTAAALAYGVDTRQEEGEKIVLVFDLGSGSLNVSLLTIDDGILEVEATAYSRLGADDFDNCLVNYVLSEIKHCYDHDFSENQQVRMIVHEECKRVKHILSSSIQTTIEIRNLSDDIDFKGSITREQFEDLCMDYFIQCILPVEKVIHDVTKFSKADIDEVILVGGSTRIPKLQELLTGFFDGKELYKLINPDEVIAYGATLQAAMLVNKRGNSEKIPELHCFDVIPFSLGIETDEGEMTTMVKREETFPFKESILFTTTVDKQSKVLIKVFEGESSLTRNNNFLSEFVFDGIASMPAGKPQINVTFEIKMDGILHVSVTEMLTGKTEEVIIKGTPKKETTSTSLEGTLTNYSIL